MFDGEKNLLANHFATFLAARSGLDGSARKQFMEIVWRLVTALEQGHSCLKLLDREVELVEPLHLVANGRDGRVTPLVLCNSNLYLHRYYSYETRLAQQILAMTRQTPPVDGPEKKILGEDLLRQFFPVGPGEIDYQEQAARRALEQTLTIITGGPGTGKTTTVVKILALLVKTSDPPLQIGLAAPTGKAAMRLSEAIGRSLARLELPEEIHSRIPRSACTLHRLLGVRHYSPQFIHNREHPMVWDLVVVDEASMVDLAMMSKLVDALKPGARLILLGDKDQLASVESGAVLGDLIQSLPASSVQLHKSYRFDDNIKNLAEAINRADSRAVWSLLGNSQIVNVNTLDQDEFAYIGKRYSEYMEAVTEIITSGHSGQYGPHELRRIFTVFNRFQVLCGVSYGDRGVEGINRRVELDLAARNFDCGFTTWYPGRPVLISRNDYSLDLFNGDIGICLPSTGEGGDQVWFERADGSFRSYSPSRLPQCETVFAMTIHKSQGSEFDEVVVILPEEDNRILSRELLYTGVTRAKNSVLIATNEHVLELALQRNISRHSGLHYFLTPQPLLEEQK